MFGSTSIFIGTSFTVAVFTLLATSNVDLIVGIPHKNIFNAKNFNPHNKPISLLNVPICTQGMQRTWWPEAGTIIVPGPYYKCYCTYAAFNGSIFGLGYGSDDHFVVSSSQIHIWLIMLVLMGVISGCQVTNDYCKTFIISRTLVGSKIVDNSDVVGASPVGAAPIGWPDNEQKL